MNRSEASKCRLSAVRFIFCPFENCSFLLILACFWGFLLIFKHFWAIFALLIALRSKLDPASEETHFLRYRDVPGNAGGRGAPLPRTRCSCLFELSDFASVTPLALPALAGSPRENQKVQTDIHTRTRSAPRPPAFPGTYRGRRKWVSPSAGPTSH